MSGGGGGGGVSSGGFGGDGGTECQKIYTGASLASPKRDVLAQVKVGDTLALEVVAIGNSYVLFALSRGKRAGSVMHTLVTQIIRCISEGHAYIALIKNLDGGNVSLEIRMEEK